MSEFTRVGVVGCGLMGAGIAEVSARAGKSVIVVEPDAGRAATGRSRVESSLKRAEERGKIANASDVLALVEVVTDLDALADRELVIEEIAEDEMAKCELSRSWTRS